MRRAALPLLLVLLPRIAHPAAAADVAEYSRSLDAKALDRKALDAEGFGDKPGLKREDDGLRVVVKPGGAETGWKTPQALRFGGDFTITAEIVLRKLPKPAQDDGAAVGLAIATGNLDQPDATLLRLVEPSGATVYRSVDRAAAGGPGMPGMHGMVIGGPGMVIVMGPDGMPRQGGKPVKPPRRVFPAEGDTFRFELRREGQTLLYQVAEGTADEPRYLGQAAIGPGDVIGVKLFAANRNGAEEVDVLFRNLTIRAARVGGLGTAVRTVFGGVVHGDPTALEADGTLVVGGPPPQPPASASNAPPEGILLGLAAVAPRPEAPAATAAATPASGAAPNPAPVPAAAATTVEAVAIAEAPAGAIMVVRQAVPAGAVIQAAPVQPAMPAQAAAAQPAPAAGAAAGQAAPDAKPKADAPPAFAPSTGAGVVAAAVAASAPAGSGPEKPKARVPLDEVAGITFERARTLAGRYLGQPNVDATMPGGDKAPDGPPKPVAASDDVLAPPPGTAAPTKIPKLEPKPNGIRDLHLSLSGLNPSEIKQVMVTLPTDSGQASWRLDTSDSNDWPLVVRRAGTEPWADLFLEPPAGDVKGKAFNVNVTYADGQAGNATIQAEKGSDPKLAFDADSPDPALDARIFLAGGDQFFGRFEGLDAEALRLRAPWGDTLAVPLERVRGLYMGLPEHKESASSFARRLENRGTDDLLLARSRDGEVVPIAGVAEGTDGDKLQFQFQERTRTLPLKQVEGLVFAARPEPAAADELVGTFTLAGGIVASGKWTGLDATNWKVETPWGQTLKLPAAEVQSVRFRGGQMTYLSDLEPAEAEHTPYFGRRSPWKRDASLSGGPLKVDGRTFARGLAVHSRTVLAYDLDGRYASFEALVGFDDESKGRGRVDCRVLADGKELFADPDLRAGDPPKPLALPVEGVRRLELVVDFGEDEDIGDRVIWADARLYRRPPAGDDGRIPDSKLQENEKK